MATAIAQDPWLQDDGFSHVDFSLRPEDEVNLDDDQHLPIIPNELDPEVIQSQPVAPTDPEPVVVAPPPDDDPETLDLEDGTQLILKKDKGWWVGSVVGHAGGSQNYKGETKNKLILEVLKAQANATKKIREQNLKLKHKPAAPAPAPAQRSGLRDLTSDEIFELNTMGQSNLAQAVEEIIKRRTGGRTLEELVTKADKGDAASRTIEIDTVNSVFKSRNPDYFSSNNNFYSLVSYLAEYKLGKVWTLENSPALYDELAATGNWTVENLEEAFTDLTSIGKLERAPKAPQPPPPVAVPVNVEPAPAPRPNERIVRTETRPRAGLGLRQTDVTPVPPPSAQQPPSAEDLESMSDEQIANLLQGVRRQRVVSRRSN